MKKYILHILIIIALIGIAIPTFKVWASVNNPNETCTYDVQNQELNSPCIPPSLQVQPYPPYVLLAPISINGQGITTFDPSQGGALGGYLNLMIKIVIGLSAVLAVVMIVIGGIEYMTSELVHSKEAGKEKITGALLGLVIALGAYALLYTINPDLLNSNLDISNATIQVDINNDVPQAPVDNKYGSYAVGADWAAIAGQTPSLQNVSWARINNTECTRVGQQGCTSSRGLGLSYLLTIHSGCPGCQLTVTGGTEFWLHSVTTTHKPGNSTVDLRTTLELTQYVMGGSTKPLQWHRYIRDGISFLYEGDHWHAGP